MTVQEAFDEGIKPLRTFMLKQTSTKDLDTFLKIAGYEEGSVKSEDDITLRVLIPSFIISELRIAFIIGFLIYLPFIVIDMVVSSTLMSMGMMKCCHLQLFQRHLRYYCLLWRTDGILL